MTSYQPSQGYIEASQRMDSVQAARLMHTQGCIIQELQREVAIQNEAIDTLKELVEAQGKTISSREAELADLRKRFDDLRSRVQEVYSYPIGR